MTQAIAPYTKISTPSRRLSRLQFVSLSIILAAAAFLRFYEIARPSLWMDEIWTIEMAMGHGSVHDHLPLDAVQTAPPQLTALSQSAPAFHVWTHLAGITHPPLYFLTLRLWMDLFGTGPAAVRSLSALFSLAAVCVFFDLCRLIHGPRIALYAAAIMALAGAQIDFAQEARSYPMVLVLALSAADLVVRIQHRGLSGTRWWLLVALLSAAALTHYFAIGILMVLAAYATSILRGRLRYTLAAFGTSALLSLTLWGPEFLAQTKSLPSFTPTFLMEARQSLHLIFTYRRIVGLPIEFLVGESPGELLCQKIPYVILALAFFIFVIPIFRLRKRPDLILWVLWLVGSVGLVTILDLLHHTTLVGYPRYTFLATPAIYGIIASFDWLGSVSASRPLLKNLVAAGAVLVLVFYDVGRVNNPPPPKEDWQHFAQTVDAAAGKNDLVVFFNPDPWVTPGSWLMDTLYFSQNPPHHWLLLSGSPAQRTLADAKFYDSILLVTLHPQSDAPYLFPDWKPTGLLRSDPVGIVRLKPLGPEHVRNP